MRGSFLLLLPENYVVVDSPPFARGPFPDANVCDVMAVAHRRHRVLHDGLRCQLLVTVRGDRRMVPFALVTPGGIAFAATRNSAQGGTAATWGTSCDSSGRHLRPGPLTVRRAEGGGSAERLALRYLGCVPSWDMWPLKMDWKPLSRFPENRFRSSALERGRVPVPDTRNAGRALKSFHAL